MTFAVNYVGAPFNTPLKENRYFALSINWSVLAFILLVLDIPPGAPLEDDARVPAAWKLMF